MDAPPVIPARDPDGQPPLAEPGDPAEPTPSTERPVAAWRRWVMLLVLLGYVAAVGWKSAEAEPSADPVLPSTTGQLLQVAGLELCLFGLLFGFVWLVGRPTRTELFLIRWDGLKTMGWSVLWSIAVRLLAMPAVSVYIGLLTVYRHYTGGDAVQLSEVRPKFEQLLPPEALSDPWYLLVAATILSFGLGGLREELWRAGVLAAFISLLPATWRNRWGYGAGIVLASIVFGGAHITQGMAGVVMTGVVGLGLGVLMVWRRSYWEPALAHGLFDATSIVTLWAIQRFFPEALKQMMGQ